MDTTEMTIQGIPFVGVKIFCRLDNGEFVEGEMTQVGDSVTFNYANERGRYQSIKWDVAGAKNRIATIPETIQSFTNGQTVCWIDGITFGSSIRRKGHILTQEGYYAMGSDRDLPAHIGDTKVGVVEYEYEGIGSEVFPEVKSGELIRIDGKLYHAHDPMTGGKVKYYLIPAMYCKVCGSMMEEWDGTAEGDCVEMPGIGTCNECRSTQRVRMAYKLPA